MADGARNIAKQATSGGANVVKQNTKPNSAGVAEAPPNANSGAVEEDKVTKDYYRYGNYQIVNKEIAVGTTKIVQPTVQFKDKPRTLVTNDGTGFGEESYIRVLDSNNKNLIPRYTKFILESYQETRQERSQIIETFGDFYVFMFGERPPMFTYSGTLINARNINWGYEFDYYYDNFLRGTKCAEKGARIRIRHGGIDVEGYILNTSRAVNAELEARVPFQFTMVVTKKVDLRKPADFGLTETESERGLAIKAIISEIAGLAGNGLSNPSASVAYNAAKGTLAGEPAVKAIASIA